MAAAGSNATHPGSCSKLLRGIGLASRQGVVQRGTEREQIAPTVERHRAQELRRHERRGSGKQRGRAHRRQQAEVDELGLAALRPSNVARCQIPVNEPPRVQQRQCRADLVSDRTHGSPRRAARARADRRRRAARARSTAARHRHRSRALARCADAKGAPACETRARRARSHERLDRDPLRSGEKLEGNVGSQRFVPGLVDRGHAAKAEQFLDVVAASDLERKASLGGIGSPVLRHRKVQPRGASNAGPNEEIYHDLSASRKQNATRRSGIPPLEQPALQDFVAWHTAC